MSATIDAPSQIIGTVACVSMVGPNSSGRVRGRGGPVGTVADTLTFADGSQGNWVLGNQRTRVGGVAMVSAASSGSFVPKQGPPPAPVTVVAGNPKIRSR